MTFPGSETPELFHAFADNFCLAKCLPTSVDSSFRVYQVKQRPVTRHVYERLAWEANCPTILAFLLLQTSVGSSVVLRARRSGFLVPHD